MVQNWFRPLKKEIYVTQDPFIHEKINVFDYMVLPCKEHPGSFAFKRKHHFHEGIDLYALEGEPVFSVEEGIVEHIAPFTGEACQSPWWHNTQAIAIKGLSGTVVYGEIEIKQGIKVGDFISEGSEIGHVVKVLKKDKGRPMSMLHLELQKKWKGQWESGEFFLSPNLLDPFSYLLYSEVKHSD